MGEEKDQQLRHNNESRSRSAAGPSLSLFSMQLETSLPILKKLTHLGLFVLYLLALLCPILIFELKTAQSEEIREYEEKGER